jgi:hypothetical protein
MTTPQHVLDCDELTPSKLRLKYRAEWNSHRAMLDRRKDGAVVADELRVFRDFLRLLGPCPAPGYTVDRLNSKDREYAPAKVQWRSKTDQSRNRGNVVILTDSDGTKRSLAEWAETTGQSRHTLHARRRRGSSDVEVIHGPNSTEVSPIDSSPHFPWPPKSAQQWEDGYRQKAKIRPRTTRRETRAEFMYRIAHLNYHALMETVELAVDPNVVPGVEHDELFRRVDGWGRVLRRAAHLVESRRNGEGVLVRFLES